MSTTWSHKQKRPRTEAEPVIQKINIAMQPHISYSLYEICGSYRRGNSMIGDLEMLIGITSNNDIDKIQTDIIVISDEILVRGQRNMSVIINDIQVDTKIAYYPTEWAFALLHFTGNSMFNIIMRAKAKRMGYKMNEKGIFMRDTNERIAAHGTNIFQTERDIFDFLKMDFKKPEDRNI